MKRALRWLSATAAISALIGWLRESRHPHPSCRNAPDGDDL